LHNNAGLTLTGQVRSKESDGRWPETVPMGSVRESAPSEKREQNHRANYQCNRKAGHNSEPSANFASNKPCANDYRQQERRHSAEHRSDRCYHQRTRFFFNPLKNLHAARWQSIPRNAKQVAPSQSYMDSLHGQLVSSR
jgi:hypothetical protein